MPMRSNLPGSVICQMTFSVSERFTSTRFATRSNPYDGTSPSCIVPSEAGVERIASRMLSVVRTLDVALASRTAVEMSSAENPGVAFASVSRSMSS